MARTNSTQANARSPSLSIRSRQNLTEAMREEAFALAQCKMLAQQARKRRENKLAEVLERTAEQHYLKHFADQSQLLDLAERNEQSLVDAVEEESFVVDVLCKLFAVQARQDGDTELARRLNAARDAEISQRLVLQDAFQSLATRRKNGQKTLAAKRKS